jgi:hypothetical protein
MVEVVAECDQSVLARHDGKNGEQIDRSLDAILGIVPPAVELL